MMTDSATGIKYTSYTQPTVRFVSLSQHDIICTSQYSMMSPNAIIGEEDNWVEETSGEWIFRPNWNTDISFAGGNFSGVFFVH